MEFANQPQRNGKSFAEAAYSMLERRHVVGNLLTSSMGTPGASVVLEQEKIGERGIECPLSARKGPLPCERSYRRTNWSRAKSRRCRLKRPRAELAAANCASSSDDQVNGGKGGSGFGTKACAFSPTVEMVRYLPCKPRFMGGAYSSNSNDASLSVKEEALSLTIRRLSSEVRSQ